MGRARRPSHPLPTRRGGERGGLQSRMFSLLSRVFAKMTLLDQFFNQWAGAGGAVSAKDPCKDAAGDPNGADIDGHPNNMWLAEAGTITQARLNGAVHYAALGGFTPRDAGWAKYGANHVAHGLA